MAVIPEDVISGWDNRKGAIILTTVDAAGMPNAIWASCVKKWDDETLVVCDNYFDKTRSNIKAGSKGSILMMTEDGKSFQVKGTIDYQTEGEIFDSLKDWVSENHPKVAAAVIKVEEVYSGAKKLA